MSAANLDLARLAIGQLTRRERAELAKEIGFGNQTPAAPEPPRLIRRAEAARILSRSTRAIDRLTVEGILHKIRLPGRSRAAGFCLSDIQALLKG